VGRRTAIIRQAAARWTEWLRSRARRMALGLAVAALLEAGAVALSVFLVMEGVRLGFL
jgi:sulfur relay (sulfurtransferase) complex TusBCD TusD component (DsrE family)